VQQVTFQGVVEGVATIRRGRLEPGRQRELAGLAGGRPRQQAPLDLSAQLETGGPLAPLEQVRVPPVGNDNESQDVRSPLDDPHYVLVRFAAEKDLK
jgi:hypothetical protein